MSDVTTGSGSPTGGESAARQELARRVDAIEAGYELMLAYAAQGLPSDTTAANGAQLREFLRRFDASLDGMGDLYRKMLADEGHDSSVYEAFLGVLDRDAAATRAGLRVVLAQPSISSQLIDNLNASIHVRALLTDVFLVDELLKG
ncbi:MAG: hypothetical protein ACT4QD_13465 [Acidobacteriota bacterium]